MKIFIRPPKIKELSIDIQNTQKRILQELSDLNSQVEKILGREEEYADDSIDSIGKLSRSVCINWINEVTNTVKRGTELSNKLNEWENRFLQADSVAGVQLQENLEDNISLRNWWHRILKDYGKLSCYAVFLILPADKEAKRYINEYAQELNLITGQESLVLMFGEKEFKSPSIGDGNWHLVVEKYVLEGYSTKIAKVFDVQYSEFPCLLIFQDIRTPEHVIVSLKGMSAEEIADKTRNIFSIVTKGLKEKKKPVEVLNNTRLEEKFKSAGLVLVSEIRKFTGKTLEVAMEAIINSVITP